MRNVYDAIAGTVVDLLLREPFYAHVLGGLAREYDDKYTRTVAIGMREGLLLLYVNPLYWASASSDPAQRRGALKHELLHLLFRHPLRAGTFSDPFLFDVAADLLVNQYLSPEEQPAGAVRLSDFPSLLLAPDRHTAYYYEKLRQCWQEGLPENKAPSAFRRLRELAGKKDELFDNHRHWYQPAHRRLAGLFEAAMRQQVRLAWQQSGSRGVLLLPAGLQRYLDMELNGRPNLDWRRIVRLFAAGSSVTFVKETIKRPSLRYGTTPGHKLRRRRHLLVAVDTSGSISAEELQAFFMELFFLWRAGAALDIVECDADILRSWSYKGRMPVFALGGGGTSFDPPIRRANATPRLDGLIYLTDGLAPAPRIACRVPVLWVISKKGVDPGSEGFVRLPGRKVKML